MVMRISLSCYGNNCSWTLKQSHLGTFQGFLLCNFLGILCPIYSSLRSKPLIQRRPLTCNLLTTHFVSLGKEKKKFTPGTFPSWAASCLPPAPSPITAQASALAQLLSGIHWWLFCSVCYSYFWLPVLSTSLSSVSFLLWLKKKPK